MKSFIVILIFLCEENIAQIPDAVAPLGQNNYWVYLDTYGYNKWKTIQISDTAKYVDSIKYFEVEVKRSDYSFSYKELFRLREDGYYVMRQDTSFPEINHEQIYYKKNAQPGDQWQQADKYYIAINDTTIIRDTLYFTLLDTAEVHFWDKTRTIKLLNIRNYGGLLDKEQIWSEEFGKLSDDHGEGFTDNLMGCIIDNVLYGDTTVTGVEEDEINVFDYSLSQNYPNPFNSTTTIEYALSEPSNVTLKVYDILGREVATLVNEFKPEGRYTILFDGPSLSSGIYFYQIQAGNFILAKKFVLAK